MMQAEHRETENNSVRELAGAPGTRTDQVWYSTMSNTLARVARA